MRKKSNFSSFRHSGVGRARSEALALSSHFDKFWMPDQVRHGESSTFDEFINIGGIKVNGRFSERRPFFR